MDQTGDRLPIIFQQKKKDIWIVMAIGAAMLVVGTAMALDSAVLVSVFGLFRAPRSTIGWIVALAGVVIALAALDSIIRGLPRLELREEGIVLKKRFGGVTRIQWREVERVDVQRKFVPKTRGLGTEVFENVVITTTRGGKVAISEMAPAAEMRETIMRVRGIER